MKKIYVGLVVLIMTCLVVSIGCRKNVQDVQGAAILTAETIAKDASFISLNEAVNRFDPEYLIKAYGDKRTVQELITGSNKLLIQLQQDPENSSAQQQFAAFYHFRNTDELKQYSARISSTLRELDARYDFKKTLFVANGGGLYAKARALFRKDKYEQLQRGSARRMNSEQKKSTGIWMEYVEGELSNFGELAYYSPDNESLARDMESGGDGCSGEICCLKNEVCRAEARGNLLTYMAVYGVGGAVGAGKLGSIAGSAAPGAGNLAGWLIGAVIGGATGSVYAFAKYYMDLDVCKAKYAVCLAEKK
jgi:hypothetical protein